MTNPAKVLSFLDITGDWDPSLAFVMGTALLVSTVAYRVPRRSEPVGSHSSIGVPAEPFSLAGIDKQLVGGAALFGVGWGLAGFCPGPALAALASGSGRVVVFASAMVAGMGLFHLMTRV